jgi:hypothetical protein
VGGGVFGPHPQTPNPQSPIPSDIYVDILINLLKEKSII